MLLRLFQISVVKRPQFPAARGLQQIERSQANRPQSVTGQVTAALAQVPRQVAQNVHQLQSFAEPHAIGQKKLVIERRVEEQVRAAHFRPEFPDTSRDAIGVIVELVVRVQRYYPFARRVGEPSQVHLLPGSDDREHFADALLVFRGKCFEQRHRFFDPLEQAPFGRRVLLLGQRGEVQRRG